MAFTLAPFVASTTLTQSAGAIPAFSLNSTLAQTAGNLPALSLSSALSPSAGNLPAFIATQDGPTQFSFTASGGMLFGGQALRSFLLDGQPAYDTFSFSLTGSGGMLFGGMANVSAVQLSVYETYPVGGVKFGGAAVVSTNWLEHHPSGGVRFGGAARFVDPVRGTGGIKFGGQGVVGAIEASISATLPSPRAALESYVAQVIVAEVRASLPRLRSSATAQLGVTARISAKLPSLYASAAGGQSTFSGRLPGIRARMEAAVGISARISGRLPTTRSVATAHCGISASLSAEIPSFRSRAVGLVGVVGSISAKIPKLAATSGATVGVSATITARLPNVRADIAAAQSIVASMRVVLPKMSARGASERVNDLLLTFVTNTLSAASTTYSDYPFNSFCEIKGEYYGASADGLYKLEVEQEDIPFKMTSGFLPFGIPQQKRASDFYMNLHSKGDLTLKVSVDEGPQYEYRLSPEDVSTLRQRRSLLGKGLKGVYWQFELEGSKDFDFDNYAVAFATTARRV